MLDPQHPIAKLLKEDRRYKLDAYAFVFEALNYAHTTLNMGAERPTETEEESAQQEAARENERHLTGQQLCEAIRQYALEQYGYMAQAVLESWGVRTTGDFGEIVFNLIQVNQMRKTKDDRREDFDNVFQFETALREGFKIDGPKKAEP